MPAKRTAQPALPPPSRHPGPEKKFGPFGAGISVAIWTNTIQTDDGPRKIRSISISPRRYLDRQSGEWRDSPSYRPGDLPALIFALQKALDFTFSEPLPDEQHPEAGNGPSSDIPY